MSNLSDLIIEIRGEKVILDFDLANLYAVSTRVLRQSVKRNIERFPNDFMFKLNRKDLSDLMSQIVTLNLKILNRRAPWAFTESGVAMLSSVLKSSKAIAVNIMIMRIFVHLRRSIHQSNEVKLKISAIEDELSKHSSQLQILFNELSNLSKDDEDSDEKIGFKVD